MSDTLSQFDSQYQNNRAVSVRQSPRPQREARTKSCVDISSFIQDVERRVVGKVNAASADRSVFAGRGEFAGRGRLYGRVTIEALSGPSQVKHVVMARQICWWILKTHARTKGFLTAPQLAVRYNRDHTTVYHGIRKIDGLLCSFSHGCHASIVGIVLDELTERWGEVPHDR